MKQQQIEQLLEAARANPAVYRALLRDPQSAADRLGIQLDADVVGALRRSQAEIHGRARDHDDRQGQDGKFFAFIPMFAALPTKRKPKAPKPRKPRKLS